MENVSVLVFSLYWSWNSGIFIFMQEWKIEKKNVFLATGLVELIRAMINTIE